MDSSSEIFHLVGKILSNVPDQILMDTLASCREEIIIDLGKRLPAQAQGRLLTIYDAAHEGSLSIMMQLAMCYERMKDPRSVDVYERITLRFPNYSSGWGSFARALESLGQTERALGVLRDGARHHDKFVEREAYWFAIGYASRQLWISLSDRDMLPYEILETRFPDDEVSISIRKLRHTQHPELRSGDDAFLKINEFLDSGRPFTAVRAGNVETRALLNDKFTESLRNNAGIHEPDISKQKASWNLWKTLYREAICDADVNFVIRMSDHYGGNLVNLLNPQIPVVYNYPSELTLSVWLRTLEKATQKGRVVIISGFSQSIALNLKNLSNIHNNKYSILVDNIITIQAPLTLADQPPVSWVSGYEKVCAELVDLDFHAAFLGCGGYGLPLVAFIRRIGKSAVYVGGHVQLLFGIWGSKWTNSRFRSDYMNEYWTNPTREEIPDGAHKVDGGGSWV